MTSIGALAVITPTLLAEIPTGPTTPGFHTAFLSLVQEVQQTWPGVPAVGGSAGNSTWGSLSLREILPTPDGSYYAVTTQDPVPLVALDAEHFASGSPASYKQKLEVYTTWIHETAHQTFLTGFDPWCMAEPEACEDYKDCYKSATGPDEDITDPCSEEYAYQKEGESLAGECARLCAEEGLSQEERDERLAELNEKIDDVAKKWGDAGGICELCAWHGVPLPSDHGDTSPPTLCECQE